MSNFIISGGNKLKGSWRVQGMKNAAAPVIAATLLTPEACVIHNIPRISDIGHLLAILEKLGVSVEWEGDHAIRIQARNIATARLDYKLAKSMRSSVLLIGPLLGRLGSVEFPEPGGCSIGNRPLDAHFQAFKDLGAGCEKQADGYYTIFSEKLQGGEITLIEKSVTATENIMMAASTIPETTVIKNAAAEPHVACLAEFLKAMGASVEGAGTHEVVITGQKELHGAEFAIIPDQLEIGTLAVLAALAGEEITIAPIVPEHMRVVAAKLKEANVRLEEFPDKWVVRNSRDVLKSIQIETAPYPGFPTDLQAPFGVLATQAQGTSIIHDPMFENRFGYVEELVKMGAQAEIIDPHTARIQGPARLHGAAIESLDLRAGATLLIAALLAEGETLIRGAEIIDRGYETIDERLRKLGADISRVE